MQQEGMRCWIPFNDHVGEAFAAHPFTESLQPTPEEAGRAEVMYIRNLGMCSKEIRCFDFSLAKGWLNPQILSAFTIQVSCNSHVFLKTISWLFCKTWLKCIPKREDSIKNKYIQKDKENQLTELQAEQKRKHCHLVSKQDLNKMNSTTGKILMRLNWLQHPIYKGGAALQFLF